MSISIEHLAELLSGIARSQQAIVDAIERNNGGWRNAHLIPLLNVAANMRHAEPRLLDLPARILLRYQGRAAVDNATIVADLQRLLALPPSSETDDVANAAAATAPAPLPPAAARMAAKLFGASAPAAPAAAPAAAPSAGSELDFSKPVG
jgi:hypothetical protein